MGSAALTTERFTFVRPASVADALAAAAEAGAGGRFWAGGTDLLLEWRRRVRPIGTCIDITGLTELRGLEVGADQIRIGALTTLAELERAAHLHPDLAVPAAIAAVMCTPQTRTLATVAGNLVNASPAADLAPPLIALRGHAVIVSPRGEREVKLEALFTGPKQTVLAADELITQLILPLDARRQAGYGRIARTVVDIALTLAVVALSIDEAGTVTTARVALGSVAPTPIRAASAECLLVGKHLSELSDDVLQRAAAGAVADASPIDDIRTSAAYRRHVTGVLVRRALVAATAGFAQEADR